MSGSTAVLLAVFRQPLNTHKRSVLFMSAWWDGTPHGSACRSDGGRSLFAKEWSISGRHGQSESAVIVSFLLFLFFFISQISTFCSVAWIIQHPQRWLSPQLYSNLCNLFILQPQEDQTPLHIASRLGKTDIVQLLLQHMAHPDAATTNGYTPLHISAREGQLETAAVLLEAGASHSLPTKVSIG